MPFEFRPFEELLMLRAIFLSLSIPALLAAIASADPPARQGSNAALKYWQAFATLPKLSDAEQQKLSEYLTSPWDAHAREILKKGEYSLKMLHQGAVIPRCDWEVSQEEGVNVLFPQAQAARVLCNLACMRARLRFEEGRNSEAVDDIVAALTLGRHISLTGTNIMLLVGYGIEQVAGETLARHLPRLDPTSIKVVQKRLDDLPQGSNTAAAMQTEETFFLDWFVRIVKEAKDKESLVARLDFVNLDPDEKAPPSGDKARAFVDRCGGSPESMLRLAEETRECYRQTVKMLEHPLEQFEKEFKAQSVQRAGNPIYTVFFPAMVNMRRAQARIDVRRALLRAALAIQLDGQDALKNHPDPVMGGSFEYVAQEGGYELRSKLKGRDGKPVVLTVGSRAK
jgi:hypothetical protein